MGKSQVEEANADAPIFYPGGSKILVCTYVAYMYRLISPERLELSLVDDDGSVFWTEKVLGIPQPTQSALTPGRLQYHESN